MKSWQPPLIVAAVLGVSVAGFALGGPGFAISFAGLCLVGLVVALLVLVPQDPIGRKPHPELDRKLLVVTSFPIEDADTIQLVADRVGLGGVESETEIRVLTPAANTFLRRWATDLEAARQRAQRNLVVSIASLTLAGVDAGARVGDENLVQAVEDELRTYDATEVYLLTRGDGDSAAAETLEERLQPAFVHLDLTRDDDSVTGSAAHPGRHFR